MWDKVYKSWYLVNTTNLHYVLFLLVWSDKKVFYERVANIYTLHTTTLTILTISQYAPIENNITL